MAVDAAVMVQNNAKRMTSDCISTPYVRPHEPTPGKVAGSCGLGGRIRRNAGTKRRDRAGTFSVPVQQRRNIVPLPATGTTDKSPPL
jgi:hypothetical protein